MKKLALVLLTVAVALFVIGWRYGGRALSPSEPSVREEHRASAPEGRQEEEAQADIGEKEDGDRDPEYLNLNVWYAMKEGDKKARPGYWRPRDKTFYAWKEVLVPLDEIPGYTSLNARALPLDLTKIHVLEIDPPVFYVQLADDSFAPGYYNYNRSWGKKFFYEWKGVTLTRRQIPDSAAKKRLLRKAEISSTSSIEPPPHRLRESQDWKKER